MDMRKLVSVIVPVFNVDKYLRKCLDTILNQSYCNLEIILVNDGSTDNSRSICEEYQKKDSRIVLVNQINAGLSAARNAGIRISHGSYIGFVDSDDYICLNMYERLVETLEEKDADIVECMVQNVTTDNEERVANDNITYREMSGKEALKELMQGREKIHPIYAVWSKLFKREIIENLKFPQGEIHEDYFYDALAFLRCKKYVMISSKLYCYRKRPNSITSVPFNLKDFDKIKHINERTEYLKKNGYTDLANISMKNGYAVLLDYYYRASQNSMFAECANIKKELISNKDKIKRCKFSRMRRMEFLLFWCEPNAYVVFRKIKNKIYNFLGKE